MVTAEATVQPTDPFQNRVERIIGDKCEAGTGALAGEKLKRKVVINNATLDSAVEHKGGNDQASPAVDIIREKISNSHGIINRTIRIEKDRVVSLELFQGRRGKAA